MVLLKIAVVILAVKRRIPAPIFIGFFVLSASRSFYLMTLSGAVYASVQAWTAPWMDGLAVAACVEAYVLACWRLPRFRAAGAVMGALAASAAAAVAWASGVVWDWPSSRPLASVAALERSVGLALAVGLGLLLLVLDRLRRVDRGALHHGAALVLGELASAAAYVIHMWRGGAWGTAVSMAGATAAYALWIWGVRRICLDEPGDPPPPYDRQAVDRAWGVTAGQ